LHHRAQGAHVVIELATHRRVVVEDRGNRVLLGGPDVDRRARLMFLASPGDGRSSMHYLYLFL
jgi:hypothetical protein